MGAVQALAAPRTAGATEVEVEFEGAWRRNLRGQGLHHTHASRRMVSRPPGLAGMKRGADACQANLEMTSLTWRGSTRALSRASSGARHPEMRSPLVVAPAVRSA